MARSTSAPGGLSNRERLRLLEDSFGAWRGREEDGAAFVERVRTGTSATGSGSAPECASRDTSS